MDNSSMKVVALAGGVGGAKLADGLNLSLDARHLTVVVNTGDDFRHFNLLVCPDLDTVCYTLAGLANSNNGWGRANETWSAMETLEMLGAPTWFRLGDRDLGWHLERTRRIAAGQTLGQITADLCHILGIDATVLPMSDDPVPTRVYTSEGEMPFQEYFVHHQCHPIVTGFRFDGREYAQPSEGVLDAIRLAELVVICPSNPWVSIDPILAIQGIQREIASRKVIAVSPIIAGKTLKGPAAKMFAEMGIQPSASAVARHYSGILSGFMIDLQDAEQAGEIEALGIEVVVENIVMKDRSDRRRLADKVLEFGKILVGKGA
ncbi:MAG: 2-phospho-L-lactate transferase [Chloroflexi bacterium RBG_16_54_18]|nr:MAG: 2-phospho-L-lactate transferase [Chloroflexi bacterium RBG_16_54_18]